RLARRAWAGLLVLLLVLGLDVAQEGDLVGAGGRLARGGLRRRHGGRADRGEGLDDLLLGPLRALLDAGVREGVGLHLQGHGAGAEADGLADDDVLGDALEGID